MRRPCDRILLNVAGRYVIVCADDSSRVYRRGNVGGSSAQVPFGVRRLPKPPGHRSPRPVGPVCPAGPRGGRGMTEASALPPECGRALQIAVMACMQTLGGDALMLADDVEDDLVLIKLARIGPRLRRGNSSSSILFVMAEQGFYAPPDWELALLHDPRLWYNPTMKALWAALEPLLPAA
jgi:hypothetical protein